MKKHFWRFFDGVAGGISLAGREAAVPRTFRWRRC